MWRFVASHLRASAALGGGKVLAAAGAFTCIGVFLDLAPAGTFAVFGIAFTAAQSIAMFASSWNGATIQRESRALMRGAVPLRVEWSIIAAGGLGAVAVAELGRLLAGLFTQGPLPSPLVIGFTAAANAAHASGMGHSLARQRPGRAALAEIARGSVLLGAGALLFLGGRVPGVDTMLLTFAAAYSASGVVGLSLLGRPRIELAPGPVVSVIRYRLGYGSAVTVWNATPPALYSLERTVVTTVLGPAAGGMYAGLQDLAVRGAYALFSPLITVLHPRVMSVADERPDRSLRRYFAIAYGLAVAVSVVAGVVAGMGWPVVVAMAPAGLADAPAVVVGGIVAAGFMWQAALIAHKPIEVARRPWQMVVNMAGAVAVGGGVWLAGVLALGFAAAGLLAAAIPLVYGAVCLGRKVEARPRPGTIRTESENTLEHP